MFKRNILVGLCVFFLGVGSVTYAADTEVTLDSNDANSGFSVKKANGETIIRAGGDGNVGIGMTSPGAKLHIETGASNDALSITGTDQPMIRMTSGIGTKTWRMQALSEGLFFIDDGAPVWRFGIAENGNVGVGTTSPSGKLHIKQGNAGISPYSNADDLVVEGSAHAGISILTSGANNDARLAFGSPDSNVGGEIFYSFDWANGGAMRFGAGSSSDRMIILGNGNVGIGKTNPGCKLDVTGSVCSNGTVLTSDVRFKKDIKPLKGALEKVSNLQGVSFRWRSDEYKERNFSKDHNIGIIAQDVEKLVPEVVHTNKDGYKGVEYSKLVPLLIEAIKEQQETISTLSAKLKVIEDRI
ncbi:MAG: tail fiber domain-containing protein [Candidatus Scalinduaceae bacterium]